MNKSEIEDKLIGKWLFFLACISLMSTLVVVSSFFIWIWVSWDLCWKVGLSGALSYVFIEFVEYVSREAVKQGIEDEIKANKAKSKFQEKLEEAMDASNERNVKNNLNK